ncbi:hypothetical protein [Leptolyngbya sp. FACHB-1624]|nr:hypothetical protein [Leptolyngbya sp. FACHB-1624]
MKIRSFRLRIALLSATLAGIALLGFGAISWIQIYSAKVNRLDADLLNQLMRAGRPRDREQRFFEDDPKIGLLVLDSEGNPRYQSAALSDQTLDQLLRRNLQLAPPAPPRRELPPIRPIPPRPQLVTGQTPTGTWRIGALNFPETQVAIAINLHAIDQEMDGIRNIFLISIPGMLLLVAGGAWIVAGRALRPVRQLTGVIQKVTLVM